ncbi:MAG: hypothetical protein BM485_10660 [Desulfobulbaceae bacterium DB1]|nr:MAG: hypothetical protein BM485_10660 [Desulfobulbaceae bacterium DB1]
MKWLKKLKVGTQLILGFSVMILFMAVIGLAGYLSTNNIMIQLNKIFTINLPGIDYLIEADRDMQQLLVAERTMILADTQSDVFQNMVKEYETNLQQAGERWEKYKAVAATAEEKDIFPKFEKAREEWQAVSRRVVDGRMADTEESRAVALALSLGEAKEKFEAMRDYLDQLTGINLKMSEAAHQSSLTIHQTAVAALLIAVGLGLFSGIFLMWALGRGVTRPLKGIIHGLSAAADQVADGSGHLASTSQILAEGASEQAASIEETSASIEELSSMTRANADNAGQARAMMATASDIVQKVNTHMGDMATAIAEINRTSEETGKIIKTIDEIAFQTNLLALNAAVEAARAGEAGAGFAVVADEVRNLAMRAAEAAKNTARLIDDTIKAVKNGNELTRATQEAFGENMDISQKVAKLVEEIAGASSEQAQGIEQINKAISEMDTVVQRVAANAEESAATSEEMNAQAEQLKVMVEELTSMVGRDREKEETAYKKTKKRIKKSTSPSGGQQALEAPSAKGKPKSKAAQSQQTKKPEEVIPFDDEFTDF